LSSGRTGRNGLNGFDPMPKRNQKTRDIENLLRAPVPVLAGNGVIDKDAMHALILRGIQDSGPIFALKSARLETSQQSQTYTASSEHR
jgi:hypothetical protein